MNKQLPNSFNSSRYKDEKKEVLERAVLQREKMQLTSIYSSWLA